MKLIDKDALIAEIERRIKEEEVDYDENGGYASWADLYAHLKEKSKLMGVAILV